MKKHISVLLILVMLATLAMGTLSGCGATSAPAEEPVPAPQEEAVSEPAEEAVAGPSYENLKLTATTSFNPAEDGCKILQYFCDYITEQSAGAIEIELYTGGTLCSSQEELGMVTSGAVDLVALATTHYADVLPLLSFPTMVLGDEQTALDYYNYLVLENPETADLISTEAAAQNVKYLGFQAGGTTCWLSTKPLAGIEDIKGIKFGANQNQSAFKALGVDVIAFPIPDGYENLSKGVIDAATMAFNPTVAMKWYEVAPNYLMLGTYVAGNPFTINLDVWNSMSDETKALFEDAAKAAADFSLELAQDGYAKNLQALEDAGCVVNTISAEEGEIWYNALYNYQVINTRSVAADAGKTAEMEIVLEAAADFVDFDLSTVAE